MTTIDRNGDLHDGLGLYTNKPQAAAGFDLVQTTATEPTSETDEPENGGVYTFPADRLATAKASIEAANRRLEKAGIDGRFEMEVEEFVRTKKLDDGSKVNIPFVNLTLSRPSIAVEGHRFLAVVDQSDGPMIVKTNGDVELEGWRPDDLTCDHCGRNIERNKTFLIEAPDGQRLQIGSTCVDLYLGVKPTGLWALGYDPISDAADYDEDSYFSGGGGKSVEKVRYTLEVALAVSDEGKGFEPSSSNRSTANQVMDYLHPPKDAKRDYWEWHAEVSERLQEITRAGGVEKVLADIEKMDDSSDYAANLKAVVAAEYVTSKNMPLLVSSLSVYRRAREQERHVAEAVPGFMAPEGASVKGEELTVTRVRHTQGYDYYGNQITKTQVVMRDADGHEVVWWASSKQDLDEGTTLRLTGGSVKKHDQFRGVDQTVLTRVKYETKADQEEFAAKTAGAPEYRAKVSQRARDNDPDALFAIEAAENERELAGTLEELIAYRSINKSDAKLLEKYVRDRWARGEKANPEARKTFYSRWQNPADHRKSVEAAQYEHWLDQSLESVKNAYNDGRLSDEDYQQIVADAERRRPALRIEHLEKQVESGIYSPGELERFESTVRESRDLIGAEAADRLAAQVPAKRKQLKDGFVSAQKRVSEYDHDFGKADEKIARIRKQGAEHWLSEQEQSDLIAEVERQRPQYIAQGVADAIQYLGYSKDDAEIGKRLADLADKDKQYGFTDAQRREIRAAAEARRKELAEREEQRRRRGW